MSMQTELWNVKLNDKKQLQVTMNPIDVSVSLVQRW